MLYRRVIFPQLLDLALSGERIERYRRQLLAHVQGSVLEIGFGTGYPATQSTFARSQG